ncbi:MAG: hypothetical protein ABIH21_02510 [Patescibacteria group bacterium]
MSRTPNYDKKIEEILDSTEPGERVCDLTGERWEMTQEEIDWYKKFNVPPAVYAPLTRHKISASFWIGYQWWNQHHAKTGAIIIAPYHPATGVSVLPDKEWFEQDFSSAGVDDNATKSVFEIVHSLMLAVPFPAGSHTKEPENSIALLSGGDRNSLFMIGCESENSLFGWWSSRLVSSCLVWNSDNVSESYSISDSKDVHDSRFIRCCKDVISSSFCFLCQDVEYCFGATNQHHKKYIFFNEQLSQAEYEARIKDVDFSRQSEMTKWVERFYDLVENKTVWPENLSARIENTTGEYNYDVNDCKECYACVKHSSNLFRCQYGAEGTQSAYASPVFSSRCYDSSNIFQSDNIRFSYAAYRCQNLEYCYLNYDCENCFGCVGLHRKKFHIFNKPYLEGVYWQKVDEIKCRMMEANEYGKFFPLWLSPMYFGESGGVNHYAARMDEWGTLGGKPFDAESAGAIGDLSQGIARSSKEIPDSINDMSDDDWVGKPVLDERIHRRFTFFKQELDYYRRKRLAPPNAHLTHRIISLLHESNLAVFENKTCAKCSAQILVGKNITFPNRKVLCRKCYANYLEENG